MKPEELKTWLNDSTIIIPSKNEASGLDTLLPKLKKCTEGAQIIVVDDGSTDNTQEICRKYGVPSVRHRRTKGNGAAIKTGARKADRKIIVFMDADGQHDPQYIEPLLDEMAAGADMVIGARDSHSQASLGRLAANRLYNLLASWMVGQRIPDLTSGLRVVYRKKFLEFIDLLPNGFSYPTTITMAFFRAGYSVEYTPIRAEKRQGKSHIKLSRDGIRFLLIIFKIGTLYSPLKIFLPVSASLFMTGLLYYCYTFIIIHRFTNMSALLLTSSITIFLMGLVAEQINNLLYLFISKDK